jgi:hypothetical protein
MYCSMGKRSSSAKKKRKRVDHGGLTPLRWSSFTLGSYTRRRAGPGAGGEFQVYCTPSHPIDHARTSTQGTGKSLTLSLESRRESSCVPRAHTTHIRNSAIGDTGSRQAQRHNRTIAAGARGSRHTDMHTPRALPRDSTHAAHLSTSRAINKDHTAASHNAVRTNTSARARARGCAASLGLAWHAGLSPLPRP